MTRAMLRALAATASAALVLALVSSVPVAADEAEATRLSQHSTGVRCHESGERLILPDVTATVLGVPDQGRAVTWSIPAEGTDAPEDLVLGPVLTDEAGRAEAPTTDVRILRQTDVSIRVASAEGRAAGSTRMQRRVVGQDVEIGPARVLAPGGYSDRILADGSHVRSLVRKADGSCALGIDTRTEVVVTAEDDEDRIHAIDRVPTNRAGFWRSEAHLPATGPFTVRLRAEHPAGFVSVEREVEMVVGRDRPRLGGGVVNASTYSERGVVVSRVLRDARHTLRVSLNQDDWRPAVKGEPARVVEVRFRHITTGKVTRLPDVRLVRKGDRRVGDIVRTMRSSGRYELTFRGSVTDEPATHTFGVRLAPRISFPARTTRAQAYRPVHRTVTIRDAKGLSAQLEHMTRNGWVPSGQSRRIPASGKVRLGSRNDTRNDRTHRVVVLQRYDNGTSGRAAVSKGTWKVLNR